VDAGAEKQQWCRSRAERDGKSGSLKRAPDLGERVWLVV